MREFGLIGYPLSHSFSKSYFKEKFLNEGISDARYENFPITEIAHLPGLIENNKSLQGLNVTIPYKEKVIPLLSNLSKNAAEIGAVNTIKITRDSKTINLEGYNTDIYGFEETLIPLLKPVHKSALILGTGGASKAVAFILRKLNIKFNYVSRTPKDDTFISYRDLNEDIISNHLIIVNTSPTGMFPKIDEAPDIPYDFLTTSHILYDLIYNPAETQFMKRGNQKGSVTINGLEMLKLQAEKAWEIWNS